jgi:MraZ protein
VKNSRQKRLSGQGAGSSVTEQGFGPVLTDSASATFFGTAYHRVSGKNQVAIPRHLKRSIDESQEGQLLLMRWQAEPFLRLYTKKQFDRKLDEVKQNEKLTAEQRMAAVDYMARMAEPVEPDSQGRFVLPGKWLDALNIREEVAFCGAFTFIKIWPAELQRQTEAAEQEKVAAIGAQVTDILNM